MAGARRRPGSHHRPLVFAAVAVILVGLTLVSLRLVPGSPLRPAAASQSAATGNARSTGTPTDRNSRPAPSPSPSPSLEPLPFVAQDLDSLGIKGWYAWSVLDKRTGKIIGSANMAETSTTASMIKSWIVADYLRRADENGQTPSAAKLADATKIIRDSDNTRAEQFYNSVGRSASIKRLISMCELTDSKVASDGGWSRTNLSPRDTARLGRCIDDGRAAGPKWTKWLLNEMRLVRGAGDFGIRKAFPANVQKTIAIKNGWIDRTREQEMHINCLAIGDTWTMGVMVRYPIGMGYDYGMKNCQKITEALLRPAT
ncbi:class A beta-lactamase-related serine hydrolase [Micromonospora sp. DR5-3]|uniref:serine hydrolase n=1 Tax=unclassified Micromonospora TaxID=2617518 RepID=UPI0011D749DE|nr:MULTISPECIES: serine hydrolase [unclassified Micromonospora]MCW3818318.1 class A beta-lactamase-related serine hydrolase [Micromonospora sp. DR5-3]TYC22086.1 serine hydrolase [Micromonospora sp. MP36]